MKEEKTNKVHEGQVMDLASSNYLEDLRETARCAYRWNSFDPEARADKTWKRFRKRKGSSTLKVTKAGCLPFSPASPAVPMQW